MSLSRVLRVFLAVPFLLPLAAAAAESPCRGSPADVEVRYLLGGEANLCDAHAGEVLLIVNTASRCGFVGQLRGLQTLHERYAARGFSVIGLPSADFGGQEFDDAQKTADFCRINYGVDFPMLARSAVTGEAAHPLMAALRTAGAPPPRWNFHKYLLARDGRYVAAFPSRVAPEDDALREAIEQALAQPLDEAAK